MKRSITRVIVLVTAATVMVLGLPLAFLVHRNFHDNAVVVLQRRAALAIGEVTLPLDAATVTRALSEADDPPDVTVYDQRGLRLTGPGPDRADRAVQEAIGGQPAAMVIGRSLVVATPINDRSTERVVGAVRVTAAQSTIWIRTLWAWTAMAGAATAALLMAWLAARHQSKRLATPVNALAATAEAIDAGRIPDPPSTCGIDEIDAVAVALHASSTRAAAVLARERAFTSDVSHQLRTPLTRLRLTIEGLAASDLPSDEVSLALREIDQIEATVEHLLGLARGRHQPTARSDPAAATRAAGDRWRPSAERDQRSLTVDIANQLPAIIATPAALDQVLDVLIDNAIQHGCGVVSVRARHAPGGVAIEVTDGGTLATLDVTQLDRRSSSLAHGIGLPLARTLIEADGGRMALIAADPTTFQILYPVHAEDVPLAVNGTLTTP